MATAIRERNVSDPPYFLRRDDAETQRLILQAKRHNPLTRWILGVAGMHDGMTVLDIGTGDVALTAWPAIRGDDPQRLASTSNFRS